MADVYEACPTKRVRRTKDEIEDIRDAIARVCIEEDQITVRGIFYRVMSRGLVPKTEAGYATVQQQALKMRRTGALDYGHIVDGSRMCYRPATWSAADVMINNAAASYRRHLWDDQEVYCEIWSEKDAISSIVQPVTDEYHVPLMVARGYSSETFLYNSAAQMSRIGKPSIVYQLGDHDPSGVGAWADIQRKLSLFAPTIPITFSRLAVTPEQIKEFDLPTRPTKKSDSRAKSFEGDSVEIDAVPTPVLRGLVRDAIESHIDRRTLDITRMVEDDERQGLLAMARGWSA